MSTTIANHLFFSTVEKTLFYIPPFYLDNESEIKAFCAALQHHSSLLSNLVGIDYKVVKSLYIESSSKYKQMRVFYIQNVKENDVPEDAFELGKDWTMLNWIRN